MENRQEQEVPTSFAATENKNNASPKETVDRLSYEERKELGRQIKRTEKQLGEIEQLIERKESDIKEIESALATPEKASDASLFERHGTLLKELEKDMQQWEKLTLELENMKTNI